MVKAGGVYLDGAGNSRDRVIERVIDAVLITWMLFEYGQREAQSR